jgi:ring-1,2-phenylacetyl-CoA epoxidase subunit PaaD
MVSAMTGIERARAIAASVADPEMPMLTLNDLGVLRSVDQGPDGTVVVTITPTYSGCPAMAAIHADLRTVLAQAGFADVHVRTALSPAWSSDWITESGRGKLAEHGIAPPGAVTVQRHRPVPLTLSPHRQMVCCPRCQSNATERISEFGATACKSLHRCRSCGEPFERVKEI